LFFRKQTLTIGTPAETPGGTSLEANEFKRYRAMKTKDVTLMDL